MRTLLLALCLGLAACASTLDVERARRWLGPPQTPSLPKLTGDTTGALPAPEGLRAVSGELRAVPLRWDPVLGGKVAGYAVERASQREGPFEPVAAVAGRAHTVWTDAGPSRWPAAKGSDRETLADGETLFYRVRAIGTHGELARSVSTVVAATTAPPPDPPTGLRAFSYQPRQVPLSWEPVSDPDVVGYVVERGPSSGGPFEAVATIEGRYDTVYVDRGLGDLRVFHYRVSASSRAGAVGEPSEPVRAVTKPQPLPPLGLRLATQRLGANELVWEPNVEPNLAGYRLLRIRPGQKPELVAVLPPEQTRALDLDVHADERVSYALVAADGDGLESAATGPVEVRSLGYELSAKAQADGVRLRWNPRGAEGYRGARVFLRRAVGQRELGFASGGTFLHRDVEPGRTYRYGVVLERADGSQAPPSTPVAVTVPGA